MLKRNDGDIGFNLKEHAVTEEWLESILSECFCESEKANLVKVTSYEVSKSVGAAETVLSDILTVSINFEIEGESKNLDVVIKLLPLDPFSRYFVTEAEFDLREIKFYTKVVKDFEDFQVKHLAQNEQPLHLPIPKCYLGKHVPCSSSAELADSATEKINESIIVLENLKKRGYQNVNFQNGLSFKQASTALSAVSNLHALSLALKIHDKTPLFEKYSFLFQTEKASSSYQHLMERGLPQLTQYLEKRTDMKKVIECLNDIRPKAKYLIEALLRPKEPISLITHTDFWSNNLLFAGDKCVLLDWQMVTCSQPTNDIAILLISSLSSDVRRNHISNLLDHYWEHFTKNARKLMVDVETTLNYGKDDFLVDYKKSQLLALLLCIGSIDIALRNTEIEQRLIDVLSDLLEDGTLSKDFINSL